ncbi:Uncharacterised protein [Chromobacterium violaceum]|uniref:Uncharacterized protein n=1 Tax=Chromobacterium violaceum TaxID=536 RepID=A0A3S4JWF5_CHRVL|nr:Uncharacterised protein [Chromobacterium violaceum]
MELKPKRFLVLDDQLVLRKLISRQASFFTRFAVEIDEFSDPARHCAASPKAVITW